MKNIRINDLPVTPLKFIYIYMRRLLERKEISISIYDIYIYIYDEILFGMSCESKLAMIYSLQSNL
jgi:hypothetical protein